MDYLPLRFKNRQIEKEFLQKTSFIIRRFYNITIVVLFIMSFYSTLYNFLSGNPTSQLARIYNVTCLAVTFTALALQIKFKLRILAPIIAFGVGIGIIIVNYVAAKEAFATLPQALYKPFVGVYYAGFMVGMFYIFLEHLFIRLHVKVGYVIIAVILRWALVPAEGFITYLNATFIDVANLVIMYLYERNNRSLFKSFYDKRDENEKFRALLTEHFPQSVVILDRKLEKKLFANRPFTEHFKAETIEEVKRLFANLKVITNTLNTSLSTDEKSFALLTSPSLVEYINMYKKDPKQDGQISSFNTEFDEGEDHKITYECKIFPLEWDGTPAFTIMFNDMTQQETILALKIADENKDRLLATVSHELRTPINGMLGITNIIENEYQDPKLLAYVQNAKVCAKMLLNLVNSILDLAQVRHNCIRLNPLNFKIQDMIKEVESIFRPQCAGKSIEFATVIEENVPWSMVSDQSRLIQIIVNLLSNALKFTTQGRILLRVSTMGVNKDEIRFSVEDTGAGIKEEDKPKLFKAFGKLEQSNPRVNSQGVGLGLTISNTLVNLLHPKKEGNKIEFESVYGEGTTFYFVISANLKRRLPIPKEESKTPRESEEKSSHGYTELMAECRPEEKMKSWKRLATPYEPSKFTKERKLEPEIHVKDLGNILSTFSEEKELLQNKDDKIEILLESPPDHSDTIPVLVVDDNPLNLMIASKLLENLGLGLTVVTAFNGQEAVNKVRQRSRTSFFKLILMDCEMPIMNGIEATQALKAMVEQGEIPDIPIYALTANESKSEKEKCIQAGMSGCLMKPLRSAEIQNIIKKISR